MGAERVFCDCRRHRQGAVPVRCCASPVAGCRWCPSSLPPPGETWPPAPTTPGSTSCSTGWPPSTPPCASPCTTNRRTTPTVSTTPPGRTGAMTEFVLERAAVARSQGQRAPDPDALDVHAAVGSQAQAVDQQGPDAVRRRRLQPVAARDDQALDVPALDAAAGHRRGGRPAAAGHRRVRHPERRRHSPGRGAAWMQQRPHASPPTTTWRRWPTSTSPARTATPRSSSTPSDCRSSRTCVADTRTVKLRG